MSISQPDRMTLLLKIEEKKSEYKEEYRSLFWYGFLGSIVLIITVMAIIGAGLLSNAYFSGWTGFTAFIFGVIFIGLVIYFFLNYEYTKNRHGFQGVGRIKHLMSLKRDIGDLQIQLRIVEEYEATTALLENATKPRCLKSFLSMTNKPNAIEITTSDFNYS